MIATAIWRALYTPGHDAAQLTSSGAGWRLHGVAVFVHESQPACLDYRLDLDRDWTTREGRIRGFIGERRVDDVILRDARGWTFNGGHVGLQHLVDLDLGFTPATNMPQVKRLALEPGREADLAVAWLGPGASTLIELPQRYERRAELSYWYESPQGPYEAMLELAPNGFVRVYPDLWKFEEN